MDKIGSKMRWLLMANIMAAELLVCSSESYGRDVTLQWAANHEGDIVKYKVYYRAGSSGKRFLSNYKGMSGAAQGLSPVDVPLAADENPDPDVVEFTLSGLSSSRVYYFVVTACDSENLESEASNEVGTNYSGPGKVYIYSALPQPSRWSNDNTVTIRFGRPYYLPAGVSITGYSSAWDMSPQTIPAESMNLNCVTSTTSEALLDGNQYYFHIRALDTVGNWGNAVHCGPFYIDTGPPGIDFVDFVSETEVEIMYSENNMRNAEVAENYAFDNGVIVSDVTDVTGEGRTFSLSLSNHQSNMIYKMTISENVTDAAGNPIPAKERTIRYVYDSDSDGMADDGEILWFGDIESRDGSEVADGMLKAP